MHPHSFRYLKISIARLEMKVNMVKCPTGTRSSPRR